MKAILEEAGSSISKVIKVCLSGSYHVHSSSCTDDEFLQTTVFLTDMKDFAEMNGMYEQYFSHKPARSCVAVKALPLGADFEIELIALA